MPRKHSSPKHSPYRPSGGSCTAKNRYATEAAARDTADHQELLHPDIDLRTYFCLQCQGWHLTRKTGYNGSERIEEQ